jgi:hypothetical protein
VPELTPAAIGQLGPVSGELIQRLNANEPLEPLARDIAAKAGVTPGQVLLYVNALIEAARQRAQNG